MFEAVRAKKEFFEELGLLCRSRGYMHAIAYFCYRDNIIKYKETFTAEDTEHLFSLDRLIRSEISTLIGLVVKVEIDYTIPHPELLQSYIDKTEALLKELHASLSSAWAESFTLTATEPIREKFLQSGEALREPIFYVGEAAWRLIGRCCFSALLNVFHIESIIPPEIKAIHPAKIKVISINPVQLRGLNAESSKLSRDRMGLKRVVGDRNSAIFIYIGVGSDLIALLQAKTLDASLRMRGFWGLKHVLNFFRTTAL